MNILLLGDIMGPSGRKAVSEKLPIIIKKNKIDFVVLNGEKLSQDKGLNVKLAQKDVIEIISAIAGGN